MSDVLRGAEVLALRRPQAGRDDVEGRELLSDPLRRRHACGGAENEPDDRGGAEAERKTRERRGRKRRLESHCAERCGQDEPDRNEAHRPHELRAHDDEHRRHAGYPQFRKPPERQQVVVHREPVGLDGPAEQASEAGDEGEREHDVPQQRPPSTEEHVHRDREGENERAHEDEAPQGVGPAENGDERLRDLLVDLGDRVRDDGRESDDDRGQREEDAVDYPSVPSTGLGVGQKD